MTTRESESPLSAGKLSRGLEEQGSMSQPFAYDPTTAPVWPSTGDAPPVALPIQPAVRTLGALSPANQALVTSMINQLAEREGISFSVGPTPGLQTPSEGLVLWEGRMRQERRSPRTIDVYMSSVTRLLKMDPVPTRTSVQRYLGERLAAGISPQRVNADRAAFRSFFGHLHEEGLWLSNPTQGIRTAKVGRKERDVPAGDDIVRVLQTPLHRRSDTPKFRLMMVLLLDTGLRITEACSIRVGNLDLDGGSVKVLGKGDKERRVPMSPLTVVLVRAYVADRQLDSGYLFPANNADGYWDRASIEKTLKRQCRRLGIHPFPPHALRHHFATHALRGGAKLEVVSRILGHSSVGITADVYRHVDSGEMAEEHRRYGPLGSLLQNVLGQGGQEDEA